MVPKRAFVPDMAAEPPVNALFPDGVLSKLLVQIDPRLTGAKPTSTLTGNLNSIWLQPRVAATGSTRVVDSL